MRPRARPRVAISVRILADVEEQRRRLLDQLGIDTPELIARAFDALEAQLVSGSSGEGAQ
jgi:hypothetical protein